MASRVILASDFWRSQDAVRSTVDPASTFVRAGSAYRAHADPRQYESKAADVLRADWTKDTNGLWMRGARLEPARTNLCKRSGATSADWSKGTVGDTTTAVDGPFGGGTAEGWVATAANAIHHRSTQLTTAAVPHCLQAILKAGLVDWVVLYDSVGGKHRYYNLATCALGSGDSTAAHIEDLGDGWCLCDLLYTPSAAARWIRVYPAESDGDVTFAGDGVNPCISFAHAQHEAGLHPSSPIVTAGAPAGRTADSTWQVAGPYPDAGQGWLAFAFTIPAHTPAAEIPILTLSDGGAAADRIRLAVNTSGLLEAQSAATGGDAGLSTGLAVADGLVHQIWVAWKHDTLVCAVDGAFGTIDSAVTIPDGLDRLELHPCGGVIGDIQMGDRFQRIPWRFTAAA